MRLGQVHPSGTGLGLNASGNLILNTTSAITFGTRGSLSMVSDGALVIKDTAGTSGITLNGSLNQLLIRDITGATYVEVDVGALGIYNGATPGFVLSSLGIAQIAAAGELRWSATSTATAAKDVGLLRNAIGVLKVTNGSTGNGILMIGGAVCRGYTSSAAGATTTEYPTDKDWGLHKNTNTAAVHLVINDGGATIKSVALT